MPCPHCSIPFTIRLPGNHHNPAFTREIYHGSVDGQSGGEVVLTDAKRVRAFGGDPCIVSRVEYKIAEENTEGEKVLSRKPTLERTAVLEF